MKVLLTGYDGYVGSELVGVLTQAGHTVVGLDAGFYRYCGFPGPSRGLVPELACADFRSVSASQLTGFDAVVHLAALSNDPLGDLDEDLTFEINHRASVRLAEEAKKAGVGRFVFASSCSLYGVSGADLLDEDATFNPLTPYGFSKVWVERDVGAMVDADFSATFLRSATAYGWSQKLRADVVVNNLVGSALTRGEVRLLSDGRSWRPLVHVRDLCLAFLAVLEAPTEAVGGRAFNVVPEGENYQVRDVADLVAKALPEVNVTFAEGSVADPRSYRVDGSALYRAVPSFRPTWTVEKGIAQLIEALRPEALSEEDFFGPRFIRLEQIRRLLEDDLVDSRLRWREVPAEVAMAAGAGDRIR